MSCCNVGKPEMEWLHGLNCSSLTDCNHTSPCMWRDSLHWLDKSCVSVNPNNTQIRFGNTSFTRAFIFGPKATTPREDLFSTGMSNRSGGVPDEVRCYFGTFLSKQDRTFLSKLLSVTRNSMSLSKLRHLCPILLPLQQALTSNAQLTQAHKAFAQ